MKTHKHIGVIEYFSVIASILFMFGCIASSYQTAETVEPKQVAMGAGYMRAENINDNTSDPIELIDLNLRYGLAKGFDMGIANSFDISSESEHMTLSTFWADFKGQLSNLDNKPGKLTFSLGLIKGYTYDYETHVSSLPVRLSVPINENLVPTLQYRITFLSDGFIPEDFENPRHEVSFGLEYSFYNHERWNPKIGFAIGTINSLAGGDGDQHLTLNLGFTLESPVSY